MIPPAVTRAVVAEGAVALVPRGNSTAGARRFPNPRAPATIPTMTTMPKPKRANSRAAVLGTKQADLRRDIATRFSADRQPGPERRSGGPPIGTGAKVPYSDELGARICAMLTAGYSLSEIATFKGMPSAHAIRHWACWPEKYPVFASAYSRARGLRRGPGGADRRSRRASD